MKKVLLLNGPNLNLLGEREKGIYGVITLSEIEKEFSEKAMELGFVGICYQSNSEGALIDKIHEVRKDYCGIVFNPGAYTHYSYALYDAIMAVNIPVIEVHISDINGREDFRKISVTAPACRAQISGLGKQSYIKGLEALHEILSSGTGSI